MSIKDKLSIAAVEAVIILAVIFPIMAIPNIVLGFEVMILLMLVFIVADFIFFKLYTTHIPVTKKNKANLLPDPKKIVRNTTYDRSFQAILIQSSETIKNLYGYFKNEIANYNDIKRRMRWDYEEFKIKTNTVFRMSFYDKYLSVMFDLNPNDYEDIKEYFLDLSNEVTYEDTRVLISIDSENKNTLAKKLFDDMIKKYNLKRTEMPAEDYTKILEYQSIDDLISTGLIKDYGK